MQEVAITGVSAINAQGIQWQASLQAMRDNAAVFQEWPKEHFPNTAHSKIARVAKFAPHRAFSDKDLRAADRFTTMTVTASGNALEAAGMLDADSAQLNELATVIGTSRPEFGGFMRLAPPVLMGEPGKLNPAFFPYIARNVACGQTCLTFGLRGARTNISSGPLAGLQSIARSADWIKHDRVQVAMAGGVECLTKMSLGQSRRLFTGHLEQQQQQFFGDTPGLLIPGEGVGLVVMETMDNAKARGATVQAVFKRYKFGRVSHTECVQKTAHDLHAILAKFYAQEPALQDASLLVCCSASGANMAHDQAEFAALQMFAKSAGIRLRLAPVRAVTGEAEAASGASQVVLASSMLTHPDLALAQEVQIGTDGSISHGPQAQAHRVALITALDWYGNYFIALIHS